MLSKKKPDCVKCGWVPVIPENFEVIELISKYANLMVDGMGAMSAQGIDKVLEWENLEYREDLIQKLIIYLTVSLKKRNEDITHGSTTDARIRSKR